MDGQMGSLAGGAPGSARVCAGGALEFLATNDHCKARLRGSKHCNSSCDGKFDVLAGSLSHSNWFKMYLLVPAPAGPYPSLSNVCPQLFSAINVPAS